MRRPHSAVWVSLVHKLLCWIAKSWAVPWGLPTKDCRLTCCRKLELVSRPVLSLRMRPRLGLGLGLVRLLWTWQGSWRSAVPRRGVAAGPPLSAGPTGTHRPCLLPKPTPRLFRSLCGSKERTDSYALGEDSVVSAREGQGREPRVQRSVSAIVPGGPMDAPQEQQTDINAGTQCRDGAGARRRAVRSRERVGRRLRGVPGDR